MSNFIVLHCSFPMHLESSRKMYNIKTSTANVFFSISSLNFLCKHILCTMKFFTTDKIVIIFDTASAQCKSATKNAEHTIPKSHSFIPKLLR